MDPQQLVLFNIPGKCGIGLVLTTKELRLTYWYRFSIPIKSSISDLWKRGDAVQSVIDMALNECFIAFQVVVRARIRPIALVSWLNCGESINDTHFVNTARAV